MPRDFMYKKGTKKCTPNFPAAQAARLISKPVRVVGRRSAAGPTPRPSQGTRRNGPARIPVSSTAIYVADFYDVYNSSVWLLDIFSNDNFMREVTKRVKKICRQGSNPLMVCFIVSEQRGEGRGFRGKGRGYRNKCKGHMDKI